MAASSLFFGGGEVGRKVDVIWSKIGFEVKYRLNGALYMHPATDRRVSEGGASADPRPLKIHLAAFTSLFVVFFYSAESSDCPNFMFTCHLVQFLMLFLLRNPTLP